MLKFKKSIGFGSKVCELLMFKKKLICEDGYLYEGIVRFEENADLKFMDEFLSDFTHFANGSDEPIDFEQLPGWRPYSEDFRFATKMHLPLEDFKDVIEGNN